MYDTSPLQYFSKTFTWSSKVTLPNIRNGLVKVTFPSKWLSFQTPQYLKGLLSRGVFYRLQGFNLSDNLCGNISRFRIQEAPLVT